MLLEIQNVSSLLLQQFNLLLVLFHIIQKYKEVRIVNIFLEHIVNVLL